MTPRAPLRRLRAWLASPKVALSLIAVVGGIVLLTTAVPQSGDQRADVLGWARAHPLAERLVTMLGFHSAYTSPIFLVAVTVLAASTAVCSWLRTKVASRRLQLMGATDYASVERAARAPSCVVEVSGPESLLRASGALRKLRLVTHTGDRFLSARSGRLRVISSPVFHWALVSLFVVLALGQLTRSEGLIGVPVGQGVPDVPGAYGVLSVGPLHRWSTTPEVLVVRSLRLSNIVSGIERGPSPTVAIVSSDGRALATKEIYPNAPLHWGSKIIHPSAYGFAAVFALVASDGSVLGTSTVFMDFRDDASSATSERVLSIRDPQGSLVASVGVQVPLQRTPNGVLRTLPPEKAVEVRVPAGGAEGSRVALAPGADVSLPSGLKLRYLSIGYYARMAVADDWSVPWLYGVFAVAIISLPGSLLLPQTAVAGVLLGSEEEGYRLALTVRDWRGSPERSSRLMDALRSAGEDRDEGERA